MFPSTRRLAAVGAAAAAFAGLTVAGAHTASASPAAVSQTAASPGATPSPSADRDCRPRAIGVGLEVLGVVAKDTGISREQLLDQLRSGATLNQIAGSKASTVEQDVLALFKARLDKAVAAGRLTADRETAMLNQARQRIDAAMAENLSSKIPSAGTLTSCGKGPLAILIRITAQQTGQSVDQVESQLHAGKTIDQIAGSKAAAVKSQAMSELEQKLSEELDRLMSHAQPAKR